jgi:hypothetical protein
MGHLGGLPPRVAGWSDDYGRASRPDREPAPLWRRSRGQPREDRYPVPEATRAALDAELVAGLLGRLRRAARSYFRQLNYERALEVLEVLVRDEGGRAHQGLQTTERGLRRDGDGTDGPLLCGCPGSAA